ncbi:MAG: hypothetical protein E6K78_05170 [Candidatus Eisenbacteria bacterium]|uniref:FlgD/Vpr Ig-like domain-containing protein n=1 Tax=Eiseniibacteriota bacterium TaxID=2212470 RepID=A0A538TUN4_UNCEI|nr:MAG: hypothetical protein E6K78_05170 [Candidatus Eisenbacteria bacterium]
MGRYRLAGGRDQHEQRDAARTRFGWRRRRDRGLARQRRQGSETELIGGDHVVQHAAERYGQQPGPSHRFGRSGRCRRRLGGQRNLRSESELLGRQALEPSEQRRPAVHRGKPGDDDSRWGRCWHLCLAGLQERDELQRLCAESERHGFAAIITWFDLRSGMTGADIYAQRIDVTGASQWSVDGIALCAAVNAQEFPTIASDGAGGAFVVWQDLRSGTNEDIYSDRISPNGVVLSVPMEGSAPSIARPWPAPFSERVQLAFVLPAATQVELDVFDVNGRRVRSFGTNVLAAGAHLFIWDGRTDDGRQADDGIYFLRVTGQGVALSRSVVRLR